MISKEEFAELAEHKASTCISIYIPTNSSGVAVNEKYDTLVFKNNLQRARTIMLEKGMDQASADALLEKGFELLANDGFWKDQSEGLAVFISEKMFKIIRLPISVKEELIVNSAFLLSPLLPLMKARKHFYLLLLSKHDSKVYEGDAWGMKKIEVQGLPNGMDDVIHYEEKGDQKTHRRAGAAAGAAAVEGANFHGHGSGLADDDEYLVQYVKEVDQTLWKELLSTQNVPLIIAAVDYVLASFKQNSHYKYIWTENLTGNYEHEDRQSLYHKVREKLEPYFKEDTKKALLNFYNNSATGLSSSMPSQVIPGAYYGQISDLFVLKGEHIWGQFDEAENQLNIHESMQEGDECLLNKAVIKTIMQGGDVHMLEKEKMPAESKIAAFMRYAV